MNQTYRIRFSMKPSGQKRSAADVETIDVQSEMDQVPGLLPARAHILYVEDLTAGRDVHWSRWPDAFRPGFGGQ